MASGASIRLRAAAVRPKAAVRPRTVVLLLLNFTLILGSAGWAAPVRGTALTLDGRRTSWRAQAEDILLCEDRLTGSLVNLHGLRRWEISNGQPPAGTAVLYRELAFWQKNRSYILAVAGILLAQGLFVWWLLIEMRKRRLAESTLKEVSRHLIGTAEQERRRVARELHDDVNQKMALLSIELDRLQSDSTLLQPALKERLARLLQDANAISSDISRVSHELHSSALEFLGLIPALRRLCRDFSEHHDTRVAFTATETAEQISSELSLCLFRIAQECLTNVARHSGARSVDVRLTGESVDALQLTVVDDGRGFDARRLDEKGGLGIVSMRERLRLVGGHLTMRSAPAEGCSVVAWVPLPKRAGMSDQTRSSLAADSGRPAKTRSRKIS